eukprot:352919-Chlamydomonas_euryale.AAC.5
MAHGASADVSGARPLVECCGRGADDSGRPERAAEVLPRNSTHGRPSIGSDMQAANLNSCTRDRRRSRCGDLPR